MSGEGARRQEAVDNSEYSGTNVELARNERELYDFIVRHSNSPPSYTEFRRAFADAKERVRGYKVQKDNVSESEAAA